MTILFSGRERAGARVRLRRRASTLRAGHRHLEQGGARSRPGGRCRPGGAAAGHGRSPVRLRTSLPPSTGSTGSRPTWLLGPRSCWRWTTPTGPMSPRSAGWPTSSTGSKVSRSWWRSRPGRAVRPRGRGADNHPGASAGPDTPGRTARRGVGGHAGPNHARHRARILSSPRLACE